MQSNTEHQHISKPANFLSTDNEATDANVRLLSATAMHFDVAAVTEHGGRMGQVRQEGLVEQVVGSTFQTFGGYDPHPDPFDKAAMLLRGITQGHLFTDGNKRTGFLMALYYLQLVGQPIPNDAPVDDIVDFCVHVSAGEIRDVGEIAQRLRGFWKRS